MRLSEPQVCWGVGAQAAVLHSAHPTGIKEPPRPPPVVTVKAPHFLFRKHTAKPHSAPSQRSFYLLVFVIVRLTRHVCVIPLVCTQPLREEKGESRPLTERKGLPLLCSLASLHGQNWILTLYAPQENDFFVYFKCGNGFFADKMSPVRQRKRLSWIA